MAVPMRLRPSTTMKMPNTMGRKLVTTCGFASVKMPSPAVMTPPTSMNGAVKPVPRMRAYWIRQTMPVTSTTTPKMLQIQSRLVSGMMSSSIPMTIYATLNSSIPFLT